MLYTAPRSLSLTLLEEQLRVFLVVHGPVDHDQFQELLALIDVTVTAHATSAAPPPRLQQSAGDTAPDRPPKIALDSVNLRDAHGANVFQSSEGPQRCYAAFELDLYLRYPQAKFHKPLVHLTASATLQAPPSSKSTPDPDADYLPSILPQPENLLANLAAAVDPTTSPGTALNLPASRLVKVAPRSTLASNDIPLLRTSSRLIPIFPMLVLRVVSMAGVRMPYPMASLDVELTRYANCRVDVEDIHVSATNLHAECMTDDLRSSLVLYPGDRSSLMYRLIPDTTADTQSRAEYVLDIEITATAKISRSCTPRLKAQWRGSMNAFIHKTPRDFPRPASTSFAPLQDMVSSRPASKHLSMTGRPQSMLGSDLGVTFAFSGPPSVNNGETFYLDVFIVNRSTRKKRLALVAIPHSARHLNTSSGDARPLSMATNVSPPTNDIADAVMDSKTLFSLRNKRQSHIAEVVCLNADVRIGLVVQPAKARLGSC